MIWLVGRINDSLNLFKYGEAIMNVFLLTYVCTGVGVILSAVMLGMLPGLTEEENLIVSGTLYFFTFALWPLLSLVLLLYILGLTMVWLIEWSENRCVASNSLPNR